MSSAGQQHGESQAKTEHIVESAKDTASAAQDKVNEAAGRDQEQAQICKEENAGILQQTGEKVANVAQGAIDGVKNTLGMGEKK